MISCKDCATPNSIDSAFCKKCGKPLAKEEALDARESLDKQLDHSFELFHHGRTDEAWLNVESCLISDPENLRATSLKGLILERRGLLYEAIDCFDTIVKKDPNAALERMKLQTLRGLLDSRKHQASSTDKRLPLAIAVCVTLLVISVAGAFAVSRNQPPKVTVAQQDTPAYRVDSFPQINSQSSNAEEPQYSSAGQTSAESQNSESGNTSAQEQNERPRATQPPLNGTLPDPMKIGAGSPENKPVNPLEGAQIQPIQSQPDTNSAAQNNTSPTTSNPSSGDPDPSAVDPSEQKASPQPFFDIRVSDNQQPRHSEATIDANGIEALVRTARGQYQVGSYQAAASTYEKALAGGADPAMTNQRLAQCYERLGRNSDAKAAYGKAIAAIQDQINGGKGNKDRLLAALNSSQQALKNLGG